MRSAQYIYSQWQNDHACRLISLRIETRAHRHGKRSAARRMRVYIKIGNGGRNPPFSPGGGITLYHSVETQPRLATAGAQCSYLYKTRSQHNSNFLLLHGKRWGRRVCGRARLHARSHGVPHVRKNRTKIPWYIHVFLILSSLT